MQRQNLWKMRKIEKWLCTLVSPKHPAISSSGQFFFLHHADFISVCRRNLTDCFRPSPNSAASPPADKILPLSDVSRRLSPIAPSRNGIPDIAGCEEPASPVLLRYFARWSASGWFRGLVYRKYARPYLRGFQYFTVSLPHQLQLFRYKHQLIFSV